LFADAFETVARECLAPDDLLPSIEVDAQLRFAEIGFSLIREIDSLKPFGVSNPEPLFMTKMVEVCERKPFSGGARFRFRQEDCVIGGVVFGGADKLPTETGTRIDLAYKLSENEWNGTSTVELKIVDARPAVADSA
jgi:single-stranded-DNA-specific exonuclease